MKKKFFSAPLKPHHQYYFETQEQALTAIPVHHQKLTAIAKSHIHSGKVVADQDYPAELMVLRPQRPHCPPLLLIGGMGPLAGLAGFAQACRMFHNSREIVLLQACAVPSRTDVMAQKLGRDTLAESRLVTSLENAIRLAVAQVDACNRVMQVIVLCNAAHYFLPQVWRQLQLHDSQIAMKLQWISLVDSVLYGLKNQHLQRPLLLCTSATRWGKVYSQPLRANGIDVIEPSAPLQAILMDCIYQGVKAFNPDFSCRAGHRFFSDLLQTQPDADCIIAGCSEVPLALRWLKAREIAPVQQFLLEFDVIDPVQLALEQAAQVMQPQEAIEMVL